MSELKKFHICQPYLPNGITFASLGCGLISILLSSQGLIIPAAYLILACVFLDFLDGYLARRLSLASSFGKQLDSLVDIVSFGVGPISLTWQHLTAAVDFGFWILPFFVMQIVAGAFRLARFNLQEPKQSSRDDSLGLTITQSGMILTMTVLADLSLEYTTIPAWVFALLSFFLSCLMISKLIFSSPTREMLRFELVLAYMVIGIVLLYFSSIFVMLLVMYLVGLTVSVARQLFSLPTRSGTWESDYPQE